MQAPRVPWPPGVGDYVRVRRDGALGEVARIVNRGEQQRYILFLFTREMRTTISYSLDDLESAWPAEL